MKEFSFSFFFLFFVCACFSGKNNGKNVIKEQVPTGPFSKKKKGILPQNKYSKKVSHFQNIWLSCAMSIFLKDGKEYYIRF